MTDLEKWYAARLKFYEDRVLDHLPFFLGQAAMETARAIYKANWDLQQWDLDNPKPPETTWPSWGYGESNDR